MSVLRAAVAKIYIVLTSTGARKFVRAMDTSLQKCLGGNYNKTILKMKIAIRNKAMLKNVKVSENSFQDICWKYEEPYIEKQGSYSGQQTSEHSRQVSGNSRQEPLVSVIVPNYNHEEYLRERLDTIYGQTYRNFEVILLDDCSTDHSREILEEYRERYADRTIAIWNEENSGHVFEQWNRGMQAARGSLIWIAESDDYSEPDFLEEMVKCFCYSSVRLAFARSLFMQEGNQIWSTEEYLHDLEFLRFDKPFFMTAANLVKYGFAVHNIIPNVSSAVFRNVGCIPEDVVRLCSGMHLSGDWLFYLSLIQGGTVAYTNATTNYYRIHSESTSLRVQKTEEYYREFEAVSRYAVSQYRIPEDVFRQNLANLKEHFRENHPGEDDKIVEEWYSLAEIEKAREAYQPHVVLACYSMKSGGGETYTMYLANEMRSQGYPVTILNFNIEDEEEGIRRLISPRVPLITINNRNFVKHVLQQLGTDVIHSHHASIDELLADWILNNEDMCSNHVITLHGMYESIAEEDCRRVVQKTNRTAKKYIYIADKNLLPFQRERIEPDGRFVKFPNGVPKVDIQPVERQSLSIPEDAFVFVLASRGIAPKGWLEAIAAVKQANLKAGTDSVPIHLVILGDGPMMEQAVALAGEDPCIHFLGTVSGVSDYFAMGDMGLLPTYFQGESYPLSVAECITAGRPVMATALAEIPNQLRAEDGSLAGILLSLKEDKVDVAEMAQRMRDISMDRAGYMEMRECAERIKSKFSLSDIVKRHFAVYEEVFGKDNR